MKSSPTSPPILEWDEECLVDSVFVFTVSDRRWTTSFLCDPPILNHPWTLPCPSSWRYIMSVLIGSWILSAFDKISSQWNCIIKYWIELNLWSLIWKSSQWSTITYNCELLKKILVFIHIILIRSIIIPVLIMRTMISFHRNYICHLSIRHL